MNNYLSRCWICLSLLNWISILTMFLLLKLLLRILDLWFWSTKFLSPKVILCLHKYTIHTCIDNCCYVWTIAFNYHYVSWIRSRSVAVGPTLAASLGRLDHCRNVTSIPLFYRYYFGGESFGLAKLMDFFRQVAWFMSPFMGAIHGCYHFFLV